MSTMIQIRNVPDALHRKLKARGARGVVVVGLPLARGAGHRGAATAEEMIERLSRRAPVAAGEIVAIIREERDRA